MNPIEQKIKEAIDAPPPVKTRADHAKEQANMVVDAGVRGVSQLVAAMNEALKRIWFNEHGLAPQEIFDALGSGAGPLLTQHGEMAAFLNEQFPVIAGKVLEKRPEHFQVVVNPDGTITATEQAIPDPSAEPE